MSQPDFSKIFFDLYGGKPKKIRYSLREGACRIHDLVFLSSFLHDARFFRSNMKLRGQRLTIETERDCWELGFNKNELYTAKSRLIFTGVTDFRWEIDGIHNNCLSEELWIMSFYFVENYFLHKSDFYDLIMLGDDWKLTIKMKEYDSSMTMQDIEVPHLYAEKNNKTIAQLT